MDASVVGYIKQLKTAQDLHEMFDSLELTTATDILLPVNDSETVLGGGTHWAQLHLQIDKKTAVYTATLYNSALGSREVADQAEEVLDRMKILLNV